MPSISLQETELSTYCPQEWKLNLANKDKQPRSGFLTLSHLKAPSLSHLTRPPGSVAWRHPFLPICFHVISESRLTNLLFQLREGKAGQGREPLASLLFMPLPVKHLAKFWLIVNAQHIVIIIIFINTQEPDKLCSAGGRRCKVGKNWLPLTAKPSQITGRRGESRQSVSLSVSLHWSHHYRVKT